MAPKKSVIDRIIAEADEAKEELLNGIDEAIEKIDKRLEPYQRLIDKKNELQAARRALLGGTRLTGGGGKQVRQEDVVDYVRRHPGQTREEIAEGMHLNLDLVRGHLYRGKDERFLTNGTGWWLRDPKNGINTADDLPDSGEDEDDD